VRREALGVRRIAAQELRGKLSVEDLTWKTPEGIAIKPLYTAEDAKVRAWCLFLAPQRLTPAAGT
jgi:hypothetical protein